MKKRKILKAVALTIDVGAPLIATMTQFPIWVERSAGATMSGVFVFFAILCAIPLTKQFKSFLKSPSAPIMWGIVFFFLAALCAIIREMLIISFVGFSANIIGWGLFKIAGTEEKEKTK